MRPKTMYADLAAGAIAVAAGAAALAIVGALAGQPTGAGAAALCAAAFLVPGLAFFNYSRRLRMRDAALDHVAVLAKEARVLDMDRLASHLGVSRADAEKILRRAVAEGHLLGRFDREDRFVPDGSACRACGAVLDRGDVVCANCGTRTGG